MRKIIASFLLLQVLLCCGQDGFLDATFNTGSGADYIVHVLRQLSNGKVMIGGQFSHFNDAVANQLVQLDADGSIDNSFSSGSGIGKFMAIADILEDDGKILAVGQIGNYNGTPRSTIVRLNPDGTLDPTFHAGTGAAYGQESQRYTLTKQNDKYILSGTFHHFNGVSVNNIVRLNQNGSVDTSFNPMEENTEVVGGIYRHCVLADGKIMVAGGFTSFNGVAIKNIARLNADGTLDSSFNPQQSSNSPIITMALQPDGKCLVNGLFGLFNGLERPLMVRLNTDGSLDDSFVIDDGFSIGATTVIVQSDAKILVGGFMTSRPGNNKFLVRLNSDGSLDDSFGDGQGVDNTVMTMTEQQDGKLLIGGWMERFNTITIGKVARLENHTLGITDFTISSDVFPNPTDNTVSLELNETNTDIAVSFFDLSGKLLDAYTFVAAKQMKFDISQYPKGLYLLKFKSAQQTEIRKIIKQ